MKLTLFLKEKYNSFTKMQKIVFLIALMTLFVLIASTLINWHIISSKAIQKINLLQADERKFLLNSELHGIKALGMFWRTNLTFTWLSNTFLVIALFIYAFHPKNYIVKQVLFLAIVYITITFVVYWTLIFGPDLKKFTPLYFFNTFIIHAVNPILGFVVWIMNRKELEVSRKTIYLSLITMVCYYFFALITFFMALPIHNELQNVQLKENATLTKELDMTIYGFLNFTHPLFYKGTNTFVIALLNIVIFVFGSVLTPLIGIFWTKAFRVKIRKR